MFQIKTMNKISPKGLAVLDESKFEVRDDFTEEHAILVRSAKLHDYTFPPTALAVARAGAGVNNIPLDRCAETGIVVFNTPGANANAVKELAMTALLLASRNIVGGVEWVRQQAKDGVDVAPAVEKGKSAFAGIEIMGKTLGVVGLGAIGRLTANAALALGMDVVAYDPFFAPESVPDFDKRIQIVPELDAVYAAADYLSLHLPMTAETRGSINEAAFAKMKPGVRIINLARGELVHNADMAKALEAGTVSCYVTDFPDSEITLVPGVVPIPHLGASTEESEENCAMMAAGQVQDYLVSGNIVNSVNLPNLTLSWDSAYRMTFLYKGGEEMAAQVSELLTKHGLNVSASANKTRGDYGYLLVNCDAAPSGDLVMALATTVGLLRLRTLIR